MMVTINGATVIRGNVRIPLHGPWTSVLEVDAATAPTGPVTVNLGGVRDFKGTVLRSGTYLQRTLVEVVGGAGGLARTIRRNYYQPSLTLRVLLGDVLREAGEQLGSTADSAVTSRVLASWTRHQGLASSALNELLRGSPGALWRVLPDGTVHVGIPTFPVASLESFDLIDDDVLAKRIVIATDDPRLDAGTTFEGRRLDLVVHRFDAGQYRVEGYYA